jgi:hypothetical protein
MSGRLLIVGVVWLLIVGAGALTYRLVFAPKKKSELVGETSSHPLHKHHVRLALDSFSGYAVLRSEEFKNELGALGVGVTLVDDKADYAARLQSLKSGETPLAVFTIDALIKASADAGELPGVIVMVIDETIGADAMIAYKQGLKNIDALNRADARIVVTRDSPSETLARVVIGTFRLPSLPADCWVAGDGAAGVYQQFIQAQPSEPKAFVLWEPYVSKALENPGAHVLMDSSRFRGYIVDVLVAERNFLKNDSAGIVSNVVKAYQTAVWKHQRTESGMVKLVSQDAEAAGEPLAPAQAQKLVQGIWWKNTQENFEHFGLRLAGDTQARPEGLQPLDEMIRKITKVLVDTKANAEDPTGGHPERLYYDKILGPLLTNRWHPSALSGVGDDAIRSQGGARPLSEAEWGRLAPVGHLSTEAIVFRRAGAELLPSGEATLDKLIDTLRSWPHYYLIVRGHARMEGDAEANKRLADERAKAVAAHLAQHGIAEHRVRAFGAETTATGGEAQTVTFVLGQLPY